MPSAFLKIQSPVFFRVLHISTCICVNCTMYSIAEVSFGLLLYLQGGIVNVTYLCHSHTVIMICRVSAYDLVRHVSKFWNRCASNKLFARCPAVVSV